MSKNTLDILFNSRPRVKILKFLFRNHPGESDLKNIVNRTQEARQIVAQELKTFKEIGLLKSKQSGTSRLRYLLNPDFDFFTELKLLVLRSSPAEKKRLSERIARLGPVKLAIVSGIFIKDTNTADSFNAVADLVIVGNDINRDKLRLFLKSLEAEVGAEINFTLMNNEEFQYRLTMFDRFVRVLMEGPHEKLINRLGI